MLPKCIKKKEIRIFRVSLEVPGVPRFLLTFDRNKFASIKQFIHFICVQTGLNKPINSNTNYILFVEDSIILNMESLRDSDRLTLVPEHLVGHQLSLMKEQSVMLNNMKLSGVGGIDMMVNTAGLPGIPVNSPSIYGGKQGSDLNVNNSENLMRP